MSARASTVRDRPSRRSRSACPRPGAPAWTCHRLGGVRCRNDRSKAPSEPTRWDKANERRAPHRPSDQRPSRERCSAKADRPHRTALSQSKRRRPRRSDLPSSVPPPPSALRAPRARRRGTGPLRRPCAPRATPLSRPPPARPPARARQDPSDLPRLERGCHGRLVRPCVVGNCRGARAGKLPVAPCKACVVKH